MRLYTLGSSLIFTSSSLSSFSHGASVVFDNTHKANFHSLYFLLPFNFPRPLSHSFSHRFIDGVVHPFRIFQALHHHHHHQNTAPRNVIFRQAKVYYCIYGSMWVFVCVCESICYCLCELRVLHTYIHWVQQYIFILCCFLSIFSALFTNVGWKSSR